VPLADLYSGASRTIRIWTQKAGVVGGAPVREPKDVDIVIEPGMRSGATVVLRGEQVSSSSCYSVILLSLDSVMWCSLCGATTALYTVVVYVLVSALLSLCVLGYCLKRSYMSGASV
jgi:hypothetical protein